jgi:hypothetical protein
MSEKTRLRLQAVVLKNLEDEIANALSDEEKDNDNIRRSQALKTSIGSR